MADELEKLLANNRDWSARIQREDPDFFTRLAAQQQPQYLWIGCSDSRVPANEIIGLMPGEVFVHRNVANVILHTDLNCLSVVEFAVKVLKVRHVIVCGHYGCGGVLAALRGDRVGMVDNWLRGVRDLSESWREELGALDEASALSRLCEINVLHQLRSLCHTSTLREAWEDGQELTVHGWIYDIHDGLVRELGVRVDADTDLRVLDEALSTKGAG